MASLRMRPDRIILGELRGSEAFTYLRAVSTGHPGSMTTIHADSPDRAVEQLAMLVLQRGVQLRRAMKTVLLHSGRLTSCRLACRSALSRPKWAGDSLWSSGPKCAIVLTHAGELPLTVSWGRGASGQNTGPD